MAKLEINDPNVLRSKALPKNTYTGTIESFQEDRGAWGDKHPDIQRFALQIRIDAHPEVEMAEGYLLYAIYPVAPGISNEIMKVVSGLGTTLEKFDSDLYLNRRVQLNLTPRVNKKTGEERDHIEMIKLEE